jgi:hypothetical protein
LSDDLSFGCHVTEDIDGVNFGWHATQDIDDALVARVAESLLSKPLLAELLLAVKIP